MVVYIMFYWDLIGRSCIFVGVTCVILAALVGFLTGCDFSFHYLQRCVVWRVFQVPKKHLKKPDPGVAML